MSEFSLVDQIMRIQWAFPPGDGRRKEIRDLAKWAGRVEGDAAKLRKDLEAAEQEIADLRERLIGWPEAGGSL